MVTLLPGDGKVKKKMLEIMDINSPQCDIVVDFEENEVLVFEEVELLHRIFE
jgi:hypothetical protein